VRPQKRRLYISRDAEKKIPWRGGIFFPAAAEIHTAAETADTSGADTMPAKLDPREVEIAALREELAAARAAAARASTRQITFKVSEKKAVSVYGLNARFPITLYADQWDRLLAVADSLRSFIADNRPSLATKETAQG
jgi:outer membrane murein-binding lipoprotein Lpp